MTFDINDKFINTINSIGNFKFKISKNDLRWIYSCSKNISLTIEKSFSLYEVTNRECTYIEVVVSGLKIEVNCFIDYNFSLDKYKKGIPL